MPAAPLPVIVNRSGGTAAALGDSLENALREAFRKTGTGIDLHLVEASDLELAVASAAKSRRVVVGGGDGTLGCAAGLLAQKGGAMAILPLGTRNHLAAQLCIPTSLAQAAKVAVGGATARIDLGLAGECVFVNNVSLGLYSRLVRQREASRLPKWLANVPAAWHVLRHLRAHSVALTVDGRDHHFVTPLLFIGNNRYSLEAGSVGARESLSRGELSLYAVAARGQLSLVAMAFRMLAGRADPERDFNAIATGREVRITGPASMDVTCDGEVRRLPLPLALSSWPGALEVVVP